MTDRRDPIERLERAGRADVPPPDRGFADRLESELRIQHVEYERRGARPAHDCLAEVADVEDAHRSAYGVVLLDRAGVLQRHRPATELRELRALLSVTLVQR